MTTLLVNRIVPAYLFLGAIAVGLHLIITPLYHDGSPDYPAWEIMNWFMSPAVVIILIASCIRNRAAKAEAPESIKSLGASLVFYGAVALTMIYFWNWFWVLNPDSETGLAVTSHLVHFPIMDVMFTVLGISVAKYLWREGK